MTVWAIERSNSRRWRIGRSKTTAMQKVAIGRVKDENLGSKAKEERSHMEKTMYPRGRKTLVVESTVYS